MNITEILITGYDHGNEVFATNLTHDRAKTIFVTTRSPDGCSTVASTHEVPAHALDPIMQILKQSGVVHRTEPVGRK